MKEAIQELEAFKAELGQHIKDLEGWKKATAENDLHVIPVLTNGQVQVHVLNFNKEGDAPGNTTMQGVPAAFFYEAYREKVEEIFEVALEKASGSVAVRAKEIKEQLASEKKALAAAEKELASYLKPAANGARNK